MKTIAEYPKGPLPMLPTTDDDDNNDNERYLLAHIYPIYKRNSLTMFYGVVYPHNSQLKGRKKEVSYVC